MTLFSKYPSRCLKLLKVGAEQCVTSLATRVQHGCERVCQMMRERTLSVLRRIHCLARSPHAVVADDMFSQYDTVGLGENSPVQRVVLEEVVAFWIRDIVTAHEVSAVELAPWHR